MEFILDLKNEQCPMNFVKTKLELEKMKSKDVLRIYLTDPNAVRDIPLSIKEEGYKVLDVNEDEDEIFELIIEKP